MAMVNMYSSVFAFSTPQSTDYYYNFPSGAGEHPAEITISDYGTGIDSSITARTTLGENNNWEVYSSYEAPFLVVRVREKSTNQTALLSFFSANSGTVYICVGDSDDQSGYPYQYYAATENYQQGQGMLTDNSSLVRRFFADTPIVPYTWSSVPKLIGNGKTYRLTEILNINDGNPVDNVPRKTNLDFSAKSKVNNMVNELMPVSEDVRKAIVRYEVPNANYEYCKIVYKKEHIPTSVTDGTAKTVDYDDTEVTISGLSPNTLYYFVVFTDKTESDPYKFRTGKQGGIIKLKISATSGIKEDGVKDKVTYTRV